MAKTCESCFKKFTTFGRWCKKCHLEEKCGCPKDHSIQLPKNLVRS